MRGSMLLTLAAIAALNWSCRRDPCGPVRQEGLGRAVAAADTTFLAAAVQSYSFMGEPDSNRARFGRLVVEAASHGAKVIVLPELCMQGYASWTFDTVWEVAGRRVNLLMTGRDAAPVAEPVPGPSTNYFCHLSESLSVYVTVPLMERCDSTGRYFNTVVVAGPTGAMEAHYRKVNPWFPAERGWTSKGDLGFPYIDTPYGRFGVMICYDYNFEMPAMVANGVTHLLYPIGWVDSPGSAWFDAIMPTFAQSCGINVIGANWSVPDSLAVTWWGYGHSEIIDCHGHILARASKNTGVEIIYAQVPMGTCR